MRYKMKENLDIRQEIINNHRILYKMHNAPCTETCMCWGLECGDGWLNEIDILSENLEALNLMLYPTFNVRIQADQVKEKYGTLCFYYSTVIDPPWYIKLYEKCTKFIFNNWLSKLNYKLKTVIDKDGYYDIVEEKIDTQKEFEKQKQYYKKNTDITFDDSNGQFIKKIKVYHCPKQHQEATKHKLLYKVYIKRYYIINFLRNLLQWEPSQKQVTISEFMDNLANNYIHNTEQQCNKVCEQCGNDIGTKYSPTCMTKGWIRYICKECADKTNYEYIMNDAIWKSGKKIKNVKRK